MKVKEDIKSIIKNAISKLNIEWYDDIEIKFSAKPDIADFQFNECFKIAKKIGVAPFEVGNKIIDIIGENELFEFSFAMPIYINIKLTDAGFNYYANEMLIDKNLTVKKHENVKTIVMDYGGANVAKALHMGHLRSPIIGEALKRVFMLKGHKVISDVHLGDFGLQMGLTLAGLEEEGYLDYYYGKNKEKPNITLELLNEIYPKASARKKEKDFMDKANDYTLKLQKKCSPYYDAYLDMRAVSVKEIMKYYKLLNVEFDLEYGESDVADIIDEVVDIFKDKGLLYESNGALVCDVAMQGEHIPIEKKSDDEVQRYKNPMPPIILKKFNGGDLYATTDVATIYDRNKKFNPDKIVYVVDNRQKQHFTQVFRACKKAGISGENQELVCVHFGTMNGSDGKPFKTRSGETIKLEDVYGMVVDKAKARLTENGVDDKSDLARQIGVAALKFGDLLNTVTKDYVCDLDKFSSFEGKTGPYIQYNGARIRSLLSKSGISEEELNKEPICVQKQKEKDIILAIFKMIDSYDICENELSLNSLCLTLYEVATAFASFYNDINILNEHDTQRKISLLNLCRLTFKALKQGMNVLAIDMPEKM